MGSPCVRARVRVCVSACWSPPCFSPGSSLRPACLLACLGLFGFGFPAGSLGWSLVWSLGWLAPGLAACGWLASSLGIPPPRFCFSLLVSGGWGCVCHCVALLLAPRWVPGSRASVRVCLGGLLACLWCGWGVRVRVPALVCVCCLRAGFARPPGPCPGTDEQRASLCYCF